MSGNMVARRVRDDMQEDFAETELRVMRSAWRSLSARWELTARERAALLPGGGEDAPSPPCDTETRMRILIEIGYRIGLPREVLHDWPRSPSPTLGWLTPLDVMSGALGELRGFRRLVERGFAS